MKHTQNIDIIIYSAIAMREERLKYYLTDINYSPFHRDNVGRYYL